jgi:hypothetical protein
LSGDFGEREGDVIPADAERERGAIGGAEVGLDWILLNRERRRPAIRR